MKLDLNWKLKELNGKEMQSDSEETIHAGKTLANLFTRTGSERVSNPVKYFDWALKLYNKQSIEVDESDLDEIKKFIKDHSTLFVIAKAQILKKLNEVVDSEEKIKKIS